MNLSSNSPPIQRINITQRGYPKYKETTLLLKEAAQIISKQYGVSVELLISRRFINHYVRWQQDKTAPLPEILTGWRKPLFEPLLLNR
ncbi:hypothetical protein PT276_10285 [Orbaceae bacterium ESL0721]|nr:hypothetical protein [Orbaceae bacterium ESL0721]